MGGSFLLCFWTNGSLMVGWHHTYGGTYWNAVNHFNTGVWKQAKI